MLSNRSIFWFVCVSALVVTLLTTVATGEEEGEGMCFFLMSKVLFD